MEKKFVIRQNSWVLTSHLSESQAENEISRLSEWFSGLEKVEVGQLEEEQGNGLDSKQSNKNSRSK